MIEIDKVLSELAGSKLIAIVPNEGDFLLKFNNGRETKVLTFSATPIGSVNAQSVLTFKSTEIIA